ncbi:MAG: helix-hairpin-helix domain-containing protein, partial [Thermoplasmata archaeon]
GIMLVVALGLLISATSLNVLAEHEPSHRYFVSGFVVQADGTPACGVVIEAGDRSGTTDGRGRYRIQLHMHDETVSPTNDVGAAIVVRVAGTDISKNTTARPSTADDGWGESRVDFSVPVGMGGECANPLLQAGIYVGLPLVVSAGLVLAYFKVIRPWWRSRAVTPPLSSLRGIGKGRLEEFRKMGIVTLDDLAASDSGEIGRRTSISRKEAKRLIRQAKEILKRGNGG